MFLARTIKDILEHSEADIEILVGLDGQWAEPVIEDHPKVSIIHTGEPVGQRAMTNMLAKIAKGKYVMKVDAHCAFDQGFDRKLLEDMQEDWTCVPTMKNLHAFDWECENGHRRYQGPSGPCHECGKPTHMEIVWHAKGRPNSTAFRFDKTLHFQYWNDLKARQKGDIVETLSLQGSCFMLSREKYFELNICDESWGSWGHQGSEVALKTWLSGGRVVVNRRTWYAHLFRTKAGTDWSFPWPASGSDIESTRQKCRDLFLDDRWPQAKMKLAELLDRFRPVPEWHE